jgi:tRNA nucleotidyltransferase (CCA-adding enzyme)
MGRPPLPFRGFPAGEWLLERAKALEVEDSAPRPIIMGRHLIRLGLEPGPHFGEILEKCYLAQIDGDFSNEEHGIELAKRLIEGD